MPLDDRAFAFLLMKVLPVWELKDYIYPRFYSLHDMPDAIAIKDENNRLPMPVLRHLSAEIMERGGLYLVKNAIKMYLWVGREVPPNLLTDLFGVESYDQIPDGMMSLPRLDSVLSKKVRNIINGLRLCHPRYMLLQIIREDSKDRTDFLRLLVDDRQEDTFSYHEFLNYIRMQISK